MKNYEYLKSIIDNPKKVEQFLCYMVGSQTEEYCDHICPVASKCYKGHNGFGAWLNEEHKKLDWRG